MITLQDILYKVHLQEVNGSTGIMVTGVEIDSRKVTDLMPSLMQ